MRVAVMVIGGVLVCAALLAGRLWWSSVRRRRAVVATVAAAAAADADSSTLSSAQAAALALTGSADASTARNPLTGKVGVRRRRRRRAQLLSEPVARQELDDDPDWGPVHADVSSAQLSAPSSVVTVSVPDDTRSQASVASALVQAYARGDVDALVGAAQSYPYATAAGYLLAAVAGFAAGDMRAPVWACAALRHRLRDDPLLLHCPVDVEVTVHLGGSPVVVSSPAAVAQVVAVCGFTASGHGAEARAVVTVPVELTSDAALICAWTLFEASQTSSVDVLADIDVPAGSRALAALLAARCAVAEEAPELALGFLNDVSDADLADTDAGAGLRWDLLFVRGRALAAAGDSDGAWDCFRQVAEHRGDYPGVREALREVG